jgi:DNA-binding IclR family transcriptional regulator
VVTDDGRQVPGRSLVSKVLAILGAFDAATTEMSLNELAQRTALPVSTTYRLAKELVELGALERGTPGGYRIGLQLWQTGSLARRLTLRDVAVPFMLDLYEVTHENTHLAVLDGHEALYVQKIAGRRSMPIKSHEARRLPLHATGVGKVLLAYGPDTLVQQVVSLGLPGFTPYTIVTPGALSRALDQIRLSGLSFSHEELTLGTTSIASPVFDADQQVIAALSIVGRSNDVDPQRLGPVVRNAALGISRQNRQHAIRMSSPRALADSVPPAVENGEAPGPAGLRD